MPDLHIEKLYKYIKGKIEFDIEDKYIFSIIDVFLEHCNRGLFNSNYVIRDASVKITSEGFKGEPYKCELIVLLTFAYCESIGWCNRIDGSI